MGDAEHGGMGRIGSTVRLITAVAVGLASLALNNPIDIVHEPIRVSFVFGSVLPLALAMAWGWRAGLASAVLGMAALYPLLAWPANGWANLPTSLLLCLWLTLHGWAADRRRTGQARWWHNAYIVELAFELLYVLHIFTVFRWSFALNPAPWAASTASGPSIDMAALIACKSLINGLIITLLADALLHLGPVRRLLRLPSEDERQHDTLIISLGAAAAIGLWSIDILVASLLRSGGTGATGLPELEQHQLVSRLLLTAIVLAFALAVAAFVRRRRRLGRELMASIARHRTALRATLDGFFLTDSGGRLLEVNLAYQVMSGYSAGELLTMRLGDLVAGSAPEAVAERIRRIAQVGAEHFEARHRRKDGSEYAVEVSVQHLAEQEGRFACFVRDIQERKRAMESLELERTLYKDLVAAMPAGVYRCKVCYADPLREDAWQQRVEISLVSEAFASILGVDRSACERDSSVVVNCIHPLDRDEFARLNIAGQQTLAPFDWEGRILRNGEVRWVRFASLPRRLDDGDVVWTGVLLDTTDLKRAEAERQSLEERLHQREKLDAVGQLAGGIAHDFNNQLAGVLGYAELLERTLDEPEGRRYAAAICTSARRAADLTQQLLAFARKGKYRSIPTDMHAMAREVASLLERSIDKRILIDLRLEAEQAVVLGDPTQLQSMLLNLGLNARDAMPEGGRLTISSRIERRSPGGSEDGPDATDQLALCVSDSGVGMDQETRRRLFEPFFTTKAAGKGTGLGLASAYGVAKNHGGAISVWSEPGRGSIFTIHLPAAAPGHLDANPAKDDRSVQDGPGGRILLVDDEPAALAVTAEILQTLGHTVRSCEDPAAALEVYRQEHRDIDLVIMDMVMPGMDGKTFFLALRRIDPQVKAILSSGYGLDDEVRSILGLGVRAFIQKPSDRASLGRTIGAVLRS